MTTAFPFLPAKLHWLDPYLRLMRLHQPTGIWLLLWPCLWGLALASHGLPPIIMMVLFGLGAVVMRGAGCAYNDIVDRDIDPHVARTRSRPIASGELTVLQGWILIGSLLLIAMVITLFLYPTVFMLAVLSLGLVAAYPFMKRYTWWPQAFLGLTFNWGAWMGWAAIYDGIGWGALFLYLGGIGWTLGYDTIYAHQDTEDDIRIGVKSTALRLGDDTRRWLAGFYIAAIYFWGLAGYITDMGLIYYIGLAITALHFAWQVGTLKTDDPRNCLFRFKSNLWLGAILFAGIIIKI